MSRPSRNVDQLLLQAGLTLLPQTGMRGLSIRQVTEKAGVNLGMFHYHFKTKDAFVRTILDQKYNDMFTSLTLVSHGAESAVEKLRAAVTVLARFGRDNRVLLVRLIGDALAGEAAAAEFMRANLPRHLGVIIALVAQAQRDGAIRKLPAAQAVAFLMGGVGAPILLGTAATNSGLAPVALGRALQESIFSDTAIAKRVDMALAGLAAPKKTGVRK